MFPKFRWWDWKPPSGHYGTGGQNSSCDFLNLFTWTAEQARCIKSPPWLHTLGLLPEDSSSACSPRLCPDSGKCCHVMLSLFISHKREIAYGLRFSDSQSLPCEEAIKCFVWCCWESRRSRCRHWGFGIFQWECGRERNNILDPPIHLEMPWWAEYAPLISFQTHSSVYSLFMKTPLLIKITSLKLQSSVKNI